MNGACVGSSACVMVAPVFSSASLAYTISRSVHAAPGAWITVVDKLSLTLGGYVSMGVGAILLGTGAVFRVKANSVYDDVVRACAGMTCPPDEKDDIDRGRSYQTTANVLLIGGSVLVGAGLAAVLWPDERRSEGPAGAGAALLLEPSSVAIEGSF